MSSRSENLRKLRGFFYSCSVEELDKEKKVVELVKSSIFVSWLN